MNDNQLCFNPQEDPSSTISDEGQSMEGGDKFIYTETRNTPQTKWHGCIDVILDGHIHGWIYKEDRSASDDCYLFIDGEFFSKIETNIPRNDLRAAGYPEGNYGFSIDLPAFLMTGTGRIVTLADKNGRVCVQGGEKLLYFPLTNNTNADAKRSTTENWRISNRNVLIIGSAPSVEEFIHEIREFQGDVWALNDAIFWLEGKNIFASKLFISDRRFLTNKYVKIRNTRCEHVVLRSDAINIDIVPENKRITFLTTIHRDGFSNNFGEIYHGCSVVFPALQCAVAAGYRKIRTCGVLLHHPIRGCLKKRWVISRGYDSFGIARFDGVHDGLDRNHPPAICPANRTLRKRYDGPGMGAG